jgi:hypothetical protein
VTPRRRSCAPSSSNPGLAPPSSTSSPTKYPSPSRPPLGERTPADARGGPGWIRPGPPRVPRYASRAAEAVARNSCRIAASSSDRVTGNEWSAPGSTTSWVRGSAARSRSRICSTIAPHSPEIARGHGFGSRQLNRDQRANRRSSPHRRHSLPDDVSEWLRAGSLWGPLLRRRLWAQIDCTEGAILPGEGEREREESWP